MSSVTIRCPRCGKSFHTAPGSETVRCPHCGRTIPLPSSVRQNSPEDEDALQKTAREAKISEAFALLNTDISSPAYDQNVADALRQFMGMVKDEKENYLAWQGLFGCLLHQCKKTFARQAKIPGTEYWMPEGTNIFQNNYLVEGYFYRVVVDEYGKFRSFQYDSILQPGRKAHLYLQNALQYADASAVEDIQKLLDLYFTNAPAKMAEKGMEYLLTRRAEARAQTGQDIHGHT